MPPLPPTPLAPPAPCAHPAGARQLDTTGGWHHDESGAWDDLRDAIVCADCGAVLVGGRERGGDDDLVY